MNNKLINYYLLYYNYYNDLHIILIIKINYDINGNEYI